MQPIVIQEIDALRGDVSTLDTSVSTVEAASASNTALITGHESRIQALEEGTTIPEGGVTQAQLAAVVTDVETNTTAIVGLSTEATAKWVTLNTVENAVNRLETRATVVEAAVVPSGAILMWSGTIANIPSGWAICNGSNGTPDLRDRFIVGAGSGYAVGATGGSTTHTHTVTIGYTTLTIAQMPSHNHINGQNADITAFGVYGSATTGVGSATYRTKGESGAGQYSPYTSATGGSGSHTHTGSSAVASTLPPYYALAFIMKL